MCSQHSFASFSLSYLYRRGVKFSYVRAEDQRTERKRLSLEILMSQNSKPELDHLNETKKYKTRTSDLPV